MDNEVAYVPRFYKCYIFSSFFFLDLYQKAVYSNPRRQFGLELYTLSCCAQLAHTESNSVGSSSLMLLLLLIVRVSSVVVQLVEISKAAEQCMTRRFGARPTNPDEELAQYLAYRWLLR